MTTRAAPPTGLQLFARYAYPPNAAGYCGADEARTLLEYAAAGVTDPGLARLARAFHGPVPYLRALAAAAGTADVFDRTVVEAYWVGGPLLDRVEPATFGLLLDDRFRRLMGGGWGAFAEAVPAGGVPHHSFHVLAVYPWVGMLDGGRDEPLRILDRCLIRWGTVVAVSGETAVVTGRPLEYDGRRLFFGVPRPETVYRASDGLSFVGPLQAGDTVAMHWDWVCDRLDESQRRRLERYTLRHLDLVNRRLGHPGPDRVLG